MSVKQKIKAITIPNTNWYYVGYEHNNGSKITEIVSLSQEYPDHTEYVYQVKSGDNTAFMIVNCPVIVEYEVD